MRGDIKKRRGRLSLFLLSGSARALSEEYNNVHALIAKGASILWSQELNFADSMIKTKKALCNFVLYLTEQNYSFFLISMFS